MQQEIKGLRAGIVGCGGVAGIHKRAMDANGITICAYADVHPESAKSLSNGEGECYADYRELIDSGRVDFISVCTPPVFHEEPVVYALERGIPVLCEKPLAATVPAARRMAEAADRSGSLLMPAFRHRFLPAVQEVKRLLPEIGPVVFFKNHFYGPAFGMADRWFSNPNISGGGCMMDISPHSIDLFRFLVGEIVETKAVKQTHLERISVEDAGAITVKSIDGAIGVLLSGWSAGAGEAVIDIVGRKGRIVFDYLTPSEVRYCLHPEKEWKVETVAASNGFKEEIAHFAGAITNRHPLLLTHRDGLRCAEVLTDAYRESGD